MKFRLLLLVSGLCLLLSSMALAQEETPPNLLDAQRFYGKISALPPGTYTLRVTIGTTTTTTVSTPVQSDGTYGYDPIFRISGQEGSVIAFEVQNAAGIRTALQNATYQPGQFTKLDMSYPVAALPPADGTNQTQTDQQDDEDDGETSTSRRRSAQNATEEADNAGTCRYNWECGGWSLCRDGLQTRYCYRLDQCDDAEEGVEVIALNKPDEQQSCQAAPAAPVSAAQACSAGQKRCFGQQLQLCSADGKEWNTLQTCSNGCDSVQLECKTAIAPQPKRAALPVWLYYLLGSVLLAAVIVIGAVTLLGKKKYAPAKEYISEAQSRGMSNMQIKEKLISQGWSAGKVEKMLK